MLLGGARHPVGASVHCGGPSGPAAGTQGSPTEWAWAWLCLQSHLGTYLSWCPVTALGPCFIRSVEEESKVRGARREQPHLGAGRAHTRGPPGWAGFLGGGQSGPDMAFREQ